MYKNKDEKKQTKVIYSDDFHESLLSRTSNCSIDKTLIRKSITANDQSIDNLNLSRYYSTLSNIFYCLSAITLKIMAGILPNYNLFLMFSIRFFFFGTFAYFFIWKENKQISSIFLLKEKKWFYIRIISNFLGLLTYKYSMDYIRLGMAVSILMFAPIWGNFFSYYFFKEKFEIKYILGCFACLIGTYIIGLGENKSENNLPSDNTIIGVFFAIANSILTAMIIMSSKFLLKTYDTYELNFTLGMYLSFYSFFMSFLHIDRILETFLNFKFLFVAFLNGIVTCIAFHLNNLSLNLAVYSKISYIGYTQIVFSLIAGCILFGENLNALDFIGSFIIIGYNFFSSKYLS